LFHAAEIKLRRCGPGEKIACRFPEDAADGFSNSFVKFEADLQSFFAPDITRQKRILRFGATFCSLHF
jgi:hypothetical protein